MSRPNILPTHEEVVRVTRQLKRRLRGLLTQFPEDEIGPGDRVFPRLLTNDWRYLRGVTYGPLDKKYIAAARWVDDYYNYLRMLREYCSYALLKPDLCAKLPLNESCMPSATDCLRLFDLQVETLAIIENQITSSNESANDPHRSELTAQLQSLVLANGLKRVAGDLKCNADTIRDLLAGKTNPRRITLSKVQAYVRKNTSVL